MLEGFGILMLGRVPSSFFLHLMYQCTYFVKRGKLMEFNHISILRFKTTQVSHDDLLLWLIYAAFDEELFKLLSIHINTHVTLSKVMEL